MPVPHAIRVGYRWIVFGTILKAAIARGSASAAPVPRSAQFERASAHEARPAAGVAVLRAARPQNWCNAHLPHHHHHTTRIRCCPQWRLGVSMLLAGLPS
ncbi:hypothetical protein C8J57DRAFT_1538222 [Mycena rebaudengoi]|nr:hypothetical protein C8J57DRAFT_1538222 [Mycena rebaudengoi]